MRVYCMFTSYRCVPNDFKNFHFSTLTRNIRERRGSKVAINIPSKLFNYIHAHCSKIVYFPCACFLNFMRVSLLVQGSCTGACCTNLFLSQPVTVQGRIQEINFRNRGALLHLEVTTLLATPLSFSVFLVYLAKQAGLLWISSETVSDKCTCTSGTIFPNV